MLATQMQKSADKAVAAVSVITLPAASARASSCVASGSAATFVLDLRLNLWRMALIILWPHGLPSAGKFGMKGSAWTVETLDATVTAGGLFRPSFPLMRLTIVSRSSAPPVRANLHG